MPSWAVAGAAVPAVFAVTLHAQGVPPACARRPKQPRALAGKVKIIAERWLTSLQGFVYSYSDAEGSAETKGANMSSNLTIGSNYEATKSLDIASVAKLVRKDVAKAKRSGLIPAVKLSVKISRYSMGQSLRTVVKAAPFQVHTDEFQAWHALADWRSTPPTRYTAEAQRVVAVIQGIVDSYNRRDVDSMTDYYNVKFHGFVDVRMPHTA